MLRSTLLCLSVCLLQNRVWATGLVWGDCIHGAVKVRHLCYKWYSRYLNSLNAQLFCEETGGYLAGQKYDFVDTINTDPLLQDFLPKNSCFWIIDYTSSHSQTIKEFTTSSYQSVRLTMWLLSMFRHDAIYHNGKLWETTSLLVFDECYYVCEFGLPILQISPQPSARQRMTIRREKESTLIVNSPFFIEVVPLSTMCSRLCRSFVGCSVFNYNTVTYECRGFGHRNLTCMANHHEWEVWSVQ